MSDPWGLAVAGFAFGVAVTSLFVDWAHRHGRGFDPAECKRNISPKETQ